MVKGGEEGGGVLVDIDQSGGGPEDHLVEVGAGPSVGFNPALIRPVR